MADAANAHPIGRVFDRAALARIADWLAVAVVVSLPWSTSATGILVVVWLIALIPTLDVATLSRELRSPAGGLPVLLWLFALLGMLWAADVSLTERIAGLGGFHRLLIVPLLLAQFRRSDRGMAVLYGFLASCTALLIVSWTARISWDIKPGWGLYIPGKIPGMPVKDYIAQSTEFMICVFALLWVCLARLREHRYRVAAGLGLLALLFLANIFYVAPGRTALAVMPLLLIVFGFREFGWKGMLAALLAGIVLAGIAWASSPLLRGRVLHSFQELRQYRDANTASSSALRLEFWKKSISFIAEAPAIGHGTGSMPELFRRAAKGETGAGAVTSVNPHNQIFAVAIQLGLIGVVLLLAMWIAHLSLFRGGGFVAWLGLVIVLQNVVSSLFNSHLFDFFHGWLYVLGVGVVGGMALRETSNAPPARSTGGP
jgi:O-antigen ligase